MYQENNIRSFLCLLCNSIFMNIFYFLPYTLWHIFTPSGLGVSSCCLTIGDFRTRMFTETSFVCLQIWLFFLMLMLEIFEVLWKGEGEEFLWWVLICISLCSVYFLQWVSWNHFSLEILLHHVAWIWCLRVILCRTDQLRRK